MVYFMENLIKMDDLGGFPPIFGLTPTSLDDEDLHLFMFFKGQEVHQMTRGNLETMGGMSVSEILF